MNQNLKNKLIQYAIDQKFTVAKTLEEAEKEYRCFNCPEEKTCKYSWDSYNIGDDYCLAEK